MIGFAIVLLVLGAVMMFALILVFGGMVWSGRIALPGSEAHRVNRSRVARQIAANEEQIAEHKAAVAHHEHVRAMSEAQTRVIEAKSVEELQEMWDRNFNKQLESGDSR